jgi:hypothetical protein
VRALRGWRRGEGDKRECDESRVFFGFLMSRLKFQNDVFLVLVFLYLKNNNKYIYIK